MTSDTRPSPLSACNIEKVGVAWGRDNRPSLSQIGTINRCILLRTSVKAEL